MTQQSSGPARALAATALAGGFVVLLVVIAVSLSGGDGGNGGRAGKQRSDAGRSADRPAPAAYVVQSGDTLTSIARKTGVSVDRIERLNPGVDPQILVSGEKLKLRETR